MNQFGTRTQHLWACFATALTTELFRLCSLPGMGDVNSIRLIYAIEAYETIGFSRHLEMATEVAAKL